MDVYELIARLTEYPPYAKVVIDGDYDIITIGHWEGPDDEEDDGVVNITSGMTEPDEVDEDDEEDEE